MTSNPGGIAIEQLQERVKALLHYNPATGVFTRLMTRCNRAQAGSIAGSVNGDGYWQIKIDGKSYQAHRLAWLYMMGEFPPNQIDHRNRVRDDNRFTNLRAATNGQNGRNSKPWGRSRFKGVTWYQRDGKWSASAKLNGKKHYLGYYATEEAAAQAYAAFAKEHFPEFARLE